MRFDNLLNYKNETVFSLLVLPNYCGLSLRKKGSGRRGIQQQACKQVNGYFNWNRNCERISALAFTIFKGNQAIGKQVSKVVSITQASAGLVEDHGYC